MVKNGLADLNNLLFEELERLMDADGDEVKAEIDRARAAADVGKSIVDTFKAGMQAAQMQLDYGERYIEARKKELQA